MAPTLLVLNSFSNKGAIKELKIGKKMPLMDRKMEDVSGNSFSLKELAGQNGIVVVFSCNTCPFVVGGKNFEGWEKQYNDLHDYANEQSISFVLVNSNAAKRDGVDSMGEMKTHAKENDYKMKYLVDEGSELADAFGAKTTPHVFVFNSDMKLTYRGMIDNAVEKDSEKAQTYFYDALKSMGKGEKISTKTTVPRGCSIKRK
jgi:peroxiredoxin